MGFVNVIVMVIVVMTDQHRGIIEIKCPYSIRNGKVDELKNKKGSFLNDAGLVRSHRYYTQVQGQLEITDAMFCDFIVWTPTDLFIQRIFKDNRFTETLLKKLNTFYVEKMLPELMTHHLMNPITTDESLQNSSSYDQLSLFCICQDVEYGDMIECENPNCNFNWFHFACVGLLQSPVGSWFCDQCRQIPQ